MLGAAAVEGAGCRRESGLAGGFKNVTVSSLCCVMYVVIEPEERAGWRRIKKGRLAAYKKGPAA